MLTCGTHGCAQGGGEGGAIPVHDHMACQRRETRRSRHPSDSLIAATALHHDLRLVTRNTSDFSFPGLEVVDTWAP
jgi:toxin FitB